MPMLKRANNHPALEDALQVPRDCKDLHIATPQDGAEVYFMQAMHEGNQHYATAKQVGNIYHRQGPPSMSASGLAL